MEKANAKIIKSLKKIKGITLIALVVTIVVLLILSSVTINVVVNNGGIISKATTAKNYTKSASIEETKTLIQAEYTTQLAYSWESFDDFLNECTNNKEIDSYSKNDDGSYTIVKDKISTKISSKLLGNTAKVGDYITYTPDNGNYTLSSEYSGESTNQDLSTDTTLKWLVASIEKDGSVLLISSTSANTIKMKDLQACNNGVYLINDICKTLYSSSKIGAVARGLKIEDIEYEYTDKAYASDGGQLSTKTYDFGVVYNGTHSYAIAGARCPIIFADQVGQAIDSDTAKSEGIGRSEQYKLVDPTGLSVASTTNIISRQELYSLSSNNSSYYKDEKFYNIIFGTGTTYLLSSRFSRTGNPQATYHLYKVGKDLNPSWWNEMQNMNGTSGSDYSNPLRPVVDLSATLEIKGGTGSIDSPYEI